MNESESYWLIGFQLSNPDGLVTSPILDELNNLEHNGMVVNLGRTVRTLMSVQARDSAAALGKAASTIWFCLDKDPKAKVEKVFLVDDVAETYYSLHGLSKREQDWTPQYLELEAEHLAFDKWDPAQA